MKKEIPLKLDPNSLGEDSIKALAKSYFQANPQVYSDAEEVLADIKSGALIIAWDPFEQSSNIVNVEEFNSLLKRHP